MRYAVAQTLALLIAATSLGCTNRRSAYAVGVTLEGTLFGSRCAYHATPAVATVDPATGRAKLVGPGRLVSDCGAGPVEWDVVRPTGLRIDGGEDLPAPGSPHSFVLQATLFVGSETLFTDARDVFDTDCRDFSYTLGADCAGVATLEEADSGWLFCPTSMNLVEAAPGTCTVEATVLGLHATRTVQLR